MKQTIYFYNFESICKIGLTDNFDRLREELAKGKLITAVESESAESIYNDIVRRYSKVRLPMSDYFFLETFQVKECKEYIESLDSIKLIKPYLTGYKLAIAYIFSWILISLLIINFGIKPVLNIFAIIPF